MGKLIDFYQRHLAESSDEEITADREQTQRAKQAHELASDIDELEPSPPGSRHLSVMRTPVALPPHLNEGSSAHAAAPSRANQVR
jgi:hypothetical protein